MYTPKKIRYYFSLDGYNSTMGYNYKKVVKLSLKKKN